MDVSLGPSATTAASHLTMIVVLILLGVRAMRMMPPELRAVIAIACVGLGIERAYYVAARFLRGAGIDLWSMHPAPEVLSLVVGVSLYAVMVPPMVRQAYSVSEGWARIAQEAVLIFSFWGLLAWALY